MKLTRYLCINLIDKAAQITVNLTLFQSHVVKNIALFFVKRKTLKMSLCCLLQHPSATSVPYELACDIMM